jgi:hypothetical protein
LPKATDFNKLDRLLLIENHTTTPTRGTHLSFLSQFLGVVPCTAQLIEHRITIVYLQLLGSCGTNSRLWMPREGRSMSSQFQLS